MNSGKFFSSFKKLNTNHFASISLVLAALLATGAQPAIACGSAQAEEVGADANAQSVPVEPRLNWSYLMDVHGSSHSFMALEALVEGEADCYCSGTVVKNFLFIDQTTSEQRWLLGHNDFSIEMNQITVMDPDAEESWRVAAFMYGVTKQDSNGDKQLNRADLKTIAFSKPDGSGYTEVLSDVEEIVSSNVTSEGETLLVYQRKGSVFSAVVDMESFQIRKETEAPKVGLKS